MLDLVVFLHTVIDEYYCGGLLCLMWWNFLRTMMDEHCCGGLKCMMWWYFLLTVMDEHAKCLEIGKNLSTSQNEQYVLLEKPANWTSNMIFYVS